MKDHFYMCLVFNTLQYSPISFARFFGTIYQARLYATTHAKIHRFDGNIFANYTRVYKVYYNEDFDIESYDYQNDYIEKCMRIIVMFNWNAFNIDTNSITKEKWTRSFCCRTV
jgi:hypothetical protein